MDSKKEDNAVGLLATREFSTPLQIAEQSSTTGTHFEQTSSLAIARLRSSQNPLGMLWIRQGDCKSQIASRRAVLRYQRARKHVLKTM